MNLSAIALPVAMGGGSRPLLSLRRARPIESKGSCYGTLRGIRCGYIGAENLRLTWASFAVYSVVPKPQVKG